MTERNRRQVLVDLFAAVGAILVSASVLGRFRPSLKRSGAPGRLAAGGTASDRARRVEPAPFAVKRHG